MDGRVLAERLLAYARAHLHLEEEDAAYARNALLTFLRLPAPAKEAAGAVPDSPDSLSSTSSNRSIGSRCGNSFLISSLFILLSPFFCSLFYSSCAHRTFSFLSPRNDLSVGTVVSVRRTFFGFSFFVFFGQLTKPPSFSLSSGNIGPLTMGSTIGAANAAAVRLVTAERR